MPPTTGNLASCTFSAGFSAAYETIEMIEQTVDQINASHLATTDFEEFIAGDLKMPGGFKITFQAVPNTYPVLRTTQTGTVTTPSGKTMSGTGFVTSFKPPTFQNNTKLLGECTFMFDGYTGPTFSA